MRSTTSVYSAAVMRIWASNTDPRSVAAGRCSRVPSALKRIVPLVERTSAQSHIASTSFSPRLNRPRLVGSPFLMLSANIV